MATYEEAVDQWAETYVTRAYESVFGRPPDPEGLEFYKDVAKKEGGGAVLDALVFSKEGQEREQERITAREEEQRRAQEEAQARALERARERDLALIEQLRRSEFNIASQYGEEAAAPLTNAVTRLEENYARKYPVTTESGMEIVETPKLPQIITGQNGKQIYNPELINKVFNELRQQYEFVRDASGYKYRKDNVLELANIFYAQATKLVVAGLNSIYDLGYEERDVADPLNLKNIPGVEWQKETVLVNKRTGEAVPEINLRGNWRSLEVNPNLFRVGNDLGLEDRAGGAYQRYDADYSTEGMADYGLRFEGGVPIFTPFYKDTRTNFGPIVALAQITAVATGNAWALPYIAGTGAALQGGDIKDILTAAAKAYVAQQIAQGFESLDIPSIPGVPPEVITGGLTGAGVSLLYGEDPLKGFVTGAAGSFTSTKYAESVGKALGFNDRTTAIVVGNGVINSALSGAQAAALKGDIGESMLAGFAVGAITARPDEVANLLVGGEKNMADLVKSTNLSVADAQRIISTSVANALVAEMQGRSFGDALRDSLVAGTLSQSAAAKFSELIDDNLSLEARNSIITVGKGVIDTAVRAELNGQNVRLALENAAPYIVTAGAISYQQTVDFLNEDKKLSQLPQNEKMLLASLDTGTLSDASNSLESEVIASFAKQVTELPGVTVTAKRTILDDALKLATDVWDRMSAYLGTYAQYQKDNVVRSIIGLANVTQSIYGVAGGGPEGLLAGNIQALDRVKQSLSKLLSAEAIQDRAAAFRILKEAEQGGFLDQVVSGFQAFAQDPAGYTSEALGTVVPNLIVANITSGASFIGRLLPQIGTNIAASVGELKNAIYETVFKEAKKVGLSDLDASFIATEAQAYDGPNTDMQGLAAAIGAVSTLVPGSFERQLINNIAAKSARDVALRAGTAGLVDAATEGIQAAQNAVAQNLAVNRIPDPREQMIREVGENTEVGRTIRQMINEMPWERALTDGVWGQAVVEALSGGIVSAGASLGLSAADINQWAQDTAREQGNWELLDKPVGSEIIVKGFVDPEVIDVFAREVGTQRLTGPEGEVEVGPGLLPGPTDEDVIDVTDIPTGEDVTDVGVTPVEPIGGGEVETVTDTQQRVELKQQVDDILANNLSGLFADLETANANTLTALNNLRTAEQEIATLQESGDLNLLSAVDLIQIEQNLNNLLTLATDASNAQELIQTQIDQIVAVQQGNVELSDTELQEVVQTGQLPGAEAEAPLTDLRSDELDLIEQILREQAEAEGEVIPEEEVISEEEVVPEEEVIAEEEVIPEEEVVTEEDGEIPPEVPTDVDEEVVEEQPTGEEETDVFVPDTEVEEPIDEGRPIDEAETEQVTDVPIEEEELVTEKETPDEETKLRPILIFEDPRIETPAFNPRVTGEALASILGTKQPLFAGDPDEQRAVWNRRSLRLRRALGL